MRRPLPVGGEDYKRRGCIGTGGFSQVFVVEHRNTRQLRAIARIKKAKLLTEKKWGLQGTLQSLEAAKMLSGMPYLMPVYVSFQDEHFLYLLMKLCDGGELRNQMVDNEGYRVRVPDDVVQRTLAELVVGIQAMHSRGVIHRDLKPENILIDSSGRVVIADYGLAVLTDKKSWLFVPNENRLVVGTLAFIAPELLARNPHTEKVDWWSLGVIAYKMAFAAFPWDTPLRSECADFVDACNKFIRIQNSTPIYFDDDGDPDLIDLITHLLDKNPQTRYGPREIRRHPFFEGVDWEEVEDMCDEPPFEPSVNYGTLMEGKDFVDEETLEDLHVTAKEQEHFTNWDWMDEDANDTFEHGVSAGEVAAEIESFMSRSSFDVAPIRIFSNRALLGRAKTIFNLLDIPVKLPVWTETGTYLKRTGLRQVRVGRFTKMADLMSVAGAGLRTLPVIPDKGEKAERLLRETELLEEADDRGNAFETQPAHVKNITLKKKFGMAVPGAVDPKTTGVIQDHALDSEGFEALRSPPRSKTHRLQKFFGDKHVDAEYAKKVAQETAAVELAASAPAATSAAGDEGKGRKVPKDASKNVHFSPSTMEPGDDMEEAGEAAIAQLPGRSQTPKKRRIQNFFGIFSDPSHRAPPEIGQSAPPRDPQVESPRDDEGSRKLLPIEYVHNQMARTEAVSKYILADEDEDVLAVLDRWRVKEEEIVEESMGILRAQVMRSIQHFHCAIHDEIHFIRLAMLQTEEFCHEHILREDHAAELFAMEMNNSLGLPLYTKLEPREPEEEKVAPEIKEMKEKEVTGSPKMTKRKKSSKKLRLQGTSVVEQKQPPPPQAPVVVGQIVSRQLFSTDVNVVKVRRYIFKEGQTNVTSVLMPGSLQALIDLASKQFGIKGVKLRTENNLLIYSHFDIEPRSTVVLLTEEEEASITRGFRSSYAPRKPAETDEKNSEKDAHKGEKVAKKAAKVSVDHARHKSDSSVSDKKVEKKVMPTPSAKNMFTKWESHAMTVLIMNPEGEIVYCNPEASTFFGMPRNRIVSNSIDALKLADYSTISGLLSQPSLSIECASGKVIRGSLVALKDDEGQTWYKWMQGEST